MEENLNNQSPEVEANTDEAPAERSIEEQLQTTANTLYKEREARKKAEKEAKTYSNKVSELESKFNSLQQQLASFLSAGEVAPAPAPVAPVEKKSDPFGSDINYQQAAKRVVSGLQEEVVTLKSELERQQSEKDNLRIELALQRAFVEAGGLLTPDGSLLDISDPEDFPIEVIKRRLRPYVKLDGDDILIVDREGKTEVNKAGMPLTLREKMEILKNSHSYSSNFRSENMNKGMGTPFNGKSVGNAKVRRVSRSAMNEGKVKPEDILSGNIMFTD